MTRFLYFPDELVLAIITFILPDDLENFAQSCQRFRSIAGSALEDHRQLIRQYSTVRNERGRTISSVLKEVFVNPEIGRYIKDLSLSYVGGTKRNIKPTYSAADLELFVAASKDSELLSSCGQSPVTCYRDIIERGNEDILLAILLPLLPNLKSLGFPRVSNNGDRCWTSHMFAYLPHGSMPTLTNLSTICINLGRIYFPLHEAEVYANLPSVKSLVAPMLCCEISSNASLFSAPNSNITNLELWQCRVPARPLHDFLLGFNCLESFAYSCDVPMQPTDEFDMFLIRSALLAKARNTLRKLTIHACCRVSSAMGTLRPFEVLNEVDTDWKILLPRSHHCMHKHELAMSLPNSLQKLTLHDRSGRGEVCYSDLLGRTVRAQERGTHVQPQPHEILAQFEWGLQLQELIIISEMDPIDLPESDPPEIHDGFQCEHVGVPKKWYRKCEEVGIALRYCVERTEKSERELRKREERMKRIRKAYEYRAAGGYGRKGWPDARHRTRTCDMGYATGLPMERNTGGGPVGIGEDAKYTADERYFAYVRAERKLRHTRGS